MSAMKDPLMDMHLGLMLLLGESQLSSAAGSNLSTIAQILCVLTTVWCNSSLYLAVRCCKRQCSLSLEWIHTAGLTGHRSL